MERRVQSAEGRRTPAETGDVSSALCPLRSALSSVRALLRLRREPGFDQAVQIAVQDAARVADLVLRPQVLHELIRLQDVRADLASPADVLLLARQVRLLRLLLLLLQRVEARAQEAHR